MASLSAEIMTFFARSVPGLANFDTFWHGDTPLRLWAPGPRGFEFVINEWVEYNPGPVDPSMFDLPSYCNATKIAQVKRNVHVDRQLAKAGFLFFP